MPERPTGLLVDWGGVLTTDVFAVFQGFCEREGLAPDTLARAFRHDPRGRAALDDLETGALDEAGFAAAFGPVIGIEDTDDLVERIFADMRPEEAMLGAVRAARAAGLRTGLISNSWGLDRYDEELMAELFDGVVLSGVVGLRKPDPEIYLLGAEAIDRLPEECVFVDDLGGNLKPARALGMQTVLHRSADETIAELERILGVSLTATA